MRSEWEANRAIDRYADLVRRVCMIHLKNHADTEGIFQTVFLKYVTGTTEFESEEHEKAWFIRVTINACKDLFQSFFRSRTVSLALPDKCRSSAGGPPGSAGIDAGTAGQVPGRGLSALL